MQQLGAISIVLICLMTGYVQTVNGQTFTPEEQAWINEHPVVSATNNMDSPPFDFVAQGQPQGIGVDYLSLVAEKIGINIRYVNNLAFDELLEQVKQQKIDIIHSVVSNERRKEFLNFTEPYVGSPAVNFGRIGSDQVYNLNDLLGKRIGVIKGWAITDAYKSVCSECILIEYDNVPDALWALSFNNIDVFTGASLTVNYTILQNYIPGLTIIGNNFVVDDVDIMYQHRLATHIDNPILFAILKKGMAAISDEEFMAISEKWLGGYESVEDIGLTVEERGWLSQNRVIKVGVDPTAAPNETIDENGKISGMSGDYLNIIAKKLNVEFERASSRSWAEALSMIKNGEVDMLSAATPNPARREFLLFTDIYQKRPNVIFTRAGGDIFGNIDSLSGHKVAQMTDFSINEFLRTNYPAIEIIEVSTANEAIKKVSSGEVDAHIGNIPRGVAAITKAGLTNIIVSGAAATYKAGNAMATRTDLPLLASALQKALASITTSQHDEIERRWLSVKVAAAPDYKLLIRLGLVALAIIIAITTWAVGSRVEIHRRRIVEKELILSQQAAAKAKDEAEKANAEKSTFLANMSHEIRTPLNAIIGFSEMMYSGIFGKIENPKYREYLQDIKNSGHHLESVINDILDLSKIEAGKWTLDEGDFDLKTCIKDAIKIIELQANDKNILLEITGLENEKLIKIYGDETAYKRVFINLLSNSVKFTGVDGVITVGVTISADGIVKIEVADNGIGIPADKIAQVLKPFSQAHDTKSSDNIGTGLGLPIVKSLAELHGGSFSLSSEENVGTNATVLIPAHRVIEQDEQKNDKIIVNQF